MASTFVFRIVSSSDCKPHFTPVSKAIYSEGMMLRRLIVFILLTALAACSRGKQYEMRGQVLGVNQEKAEVLVDHEAIEGWMPAMTMSYTVSDPALLSGLQPGDLITVESARRRTFA